jgi:hypothetical protein
LPLKVSGNLPIWRQQSNEFIFNKKDRARRSFPQMLRSSSTFVVNWAVLGGDYAVINFWCLGRRRVLLTLRERRIVWLERDLPGAACPKYG